MRRLVSSSRVLVVNKGYEDHPSVGVSPPRARDMNLITAGSHFYSQLSFTLYPMVFFCVLFVTTQSHKFSHRYCVICFGHR